ncbi:hypothetical protein [Flavobacterium chungangense]|uniref:PsbP C-terminal domain-containing protein n=1 Tax=Flavobacterium chungangense TaxID=554283 RepID=A0A6V6YT23_9FLAO|nr:hypothetical protein [Flavobacterium chungangense]CAD0001852.1 hypothetical protein FLACHUCJ7_00703 [Flavobacterium chungangense]
MNKKIIIIIIALAFIGTGVTAQTKMKEYKAGHVFNISLPDYMNKTAGINTSSAIQYKSEVKEVYGFVIFDTKEELGYLELNYNSINDFYEDFMKDFLTDEDKKEISKSVSKKIGENNFIESDATYFDKDANMEIYYLIGIVETKKAFYKVLSWTSKEKKDTFKADFQKILYSLKD